MFARAAVRPVTRVAAQRRAASTTAAPGAPKTLWQTWYEPAAIPIWVVVGTACFGAGWYLTRLARHQDVIWDRHGNPEPWNNVQPGTLSKLYTHHPEKFDRVYSRDRF
ncbi:hypothetical protein NBRC10512_002702 [Rhodotorula toruloides]|uniref:RHTO0S01e08108g1_1 n=2 Tax=Rhodotorula toruloides TaxID=5286 RepID=A0A061AKJ7_RHOTO|nr:NADH dehydrogenase [ubiquinone] 1 alpha subcomplex subunit 4 [Rhodotorula toruloides NP11]EMS24711.1 NADH dehydrogenase [ubiquinone] 1 alpha subcomplex subunit 4 [Rhodotorula toruloides NP11]CDR35833.1 RHTO0S01e08108g1_1 [Rhodotorula toruloides]